MMREDKKKKKEREILNLWLEKFNYKYSPIPIDPPDFKIKTESGILGVEITEYYPDYEKKGSALKKEYAHLNKVWDKTRALLKAKYPYYSIFINYYHSPDKKIKFKYEDIENYLNKHINDKTEREVVDIREGNIERIVIEKKDRESGLNTMAITDYNKFNENTLREIIKDKTNLQENWRNSFNQKILLIHTSLDFSNNINCPKKLTSDFTEFNMYWDKIFMLFQVQSNDWEFLAIV